MTDAELAPARGGRPGSGLARRVTATARNVTEVVRFGGLETDEEPSPFLVAAEGLNYRLRHYFADDVAGGAQPILLIPPLMLTTEVWDVAPDASAVATLHKAGLDTYVVDFGRPDRDPGGLERDLTDHVLAVSEAIDRVRELTGQDVVLGGYSQGGMFAYQAAAFRRCAGIDSLVTFGSPVDASAPLPIPLSPEAASRIAAGLIDSGLLRKLALPGWASRVGFKLLTPAKSVQDRLKFLMTLHDRDKLLPKERTRRFLENDGWTAWSGPALANFLEMYFQHNRILEGGFVIDDRLVTLADIDVAILTVVGSTDTIGHPDSVRAIRRAAPSADIYELTLRAGHFGLVVGSTAMAHTWPAVADWVRWRHGEAPLPDTIVAAEQVTASSYRTSGASSMLTQATELGVGATRIAIGTARSAVRLARSVVTEVPAQLPRLARIEQLDPLTRISLGLLLDEQARRNHRAICLLFGDRAHRQDEVKYRVDSVVRGLISVGVRHGDRVGVLMNTRPSAFTVIAAISRLGATAVMLRPDADVEREAALGRITWIVADPEHADTAVAGVQVAVLGGGTDDRELPGDVIDMERIDPDKVDLPAWYQPNQGRAGDIAFVLFTGEGAGTRAVPISNKRWALSALGTASAAAFHEGDTVYSVTPLHHSSALLMSIGGAVAGGARLAMATGNDADTFWDEVRRYGATHVSYTWSSLREITYAPQHPNERYHPIRMFIGSGMPRNLWTRVAERFPDAKVLEFYASAEGEAILANLGGQKPGSMGRPLPGTAEVRVAAFDLATKRLKLTSDGLARESLADEIGLLLTRVAPSDLGTGGIGTVLRGVFMTDDIWRTTGDLFLRDQQGDHWLAGPVAEIVETAQGPVLPAGTRFCLGSIPAVDLLVAYGVPDGDAHVLVGAVTLRPDTTLRTEDLDAVMERLPKRHRPRYVQVVAALPLTTWHRPIWRELQKRGIPRPRRGVSVWQLDEQTGRYARVDAT